MNSGPKPLALEHQDPQEVGCDHEGRQEEHRQRLGHSVSGHTLPERDQVTVGGAGVVGQQQRWGTAGIKDLLCKIMHDHTVMNGSGQPFPKCGDVKLGTVAHCHPLW